MFKFAQFWFYALQMRRSYYAAEKAKDEESTFQFLRKVRQAGRAALQIQSPFIHERWRVAMKKNLVSLHGLYQRGVIARIPEEDLETVVYTIKVLNDWAEMNIQPNASQIAALLNVFDIKKRHLNLFIPRSLLRGYLVGKSLRNRRFLNINLSA